MPTSYPLNPRQAELYRFHELYPHDPSYNQTFLYQVDGKFNLARFKAIYEAVYNSCDLLLVHFNGTGCKARQIHDPSRYYNLELFSSFSDESQTDFEQRVKRYAHTLANTPIDLTSWPLYRVMLWHYDDSLSYQLVVQPHIITDGHSYNWLIDLVDSYYNCSLPTEQIVKRLSESTQASFLADLAYQHDCKPTPKLSDQVEQLSSFKLETIKQNRSGATKTLPGKLVRTPLIKSDVDQVTSQHGITANTYLLALYALFVYKTTGEHMVVIGFPVPNRTKNNRQIFGFYANTLPLVLDFTKITTMMELWRSIKSGVYHLLRNQAAALPGKTKNYNCLFTFYPQEFKHSLSGCQYQQLELSKDKILAECRCAVESRSTSYLIMLECGDYYANVPVSLLLTNFNNQILANSELELDAIDYLTPQQVKQLYASVNNYRPLVATQSLKDRFEAIAALYPEHIAVVDQQTSWSYSTLNYLANQYARQLASASNANIYLVMLPRSNDLLAVILAIIKLGACFVPIDPDYTLARAPYIVSELSQAQLITTQSLHLAAQLTSDHYLEHKMLLTGAAQRSGSNLSHTPNQNDLSYIIYTSGSTGKPKGVMVSQDNLLSLIDACYDKMTFTTQDNWTMSHCYAFDFAVWELFGCVLSGGTLHLVAKDIAQDSARFYQLLCQQNITVLNQTPSSFKRIIAQDEWQQQSLQLKYVIFGGEALNFATLKPWVKRHRLNGTKLINMYGITETTIHATFLAIQDHHLTTKSSLVGKPLTNAEIYTISDKGKILPPGLAGELLICGSAVSQGYYRQPELTEQKFSSTADGLRCYSSGDLGRIMANGQIEHLGRIDRQVQIRGFRVELAEVESAILPAPGIVECVADQVTIGASTKLVVFYRCCGQVTTQEVQKHANRHLPAYLLPDLFVLIDHMPLTANAKIDRAALHRLINNGNKKQLQHRRSNTEQQLVTIVAAIIGHSNININTSFFDLGLNSADLPMLQLEIAKQLNIESLQLMDIFTYPTVAKLASFIGTKESCNLKLTG